VTLNIGACNRRRIFDKKSKSIDPCLVCWLPIVDDVRTTIYALSREIMIPAVKMSGIFNVSGTFYVESDSSS
jgi:hypothetical protein